MKNMNPQKSLTASKVGLKSLEVDPYYIQISPLNNSSSKMQYSFPKTDRFEQKKKIISPEFYDLPDGKSKRSTTLGYGNKTQLAHTTIVSPAPNNYILKSQFQLKNNQGLTMSPGRQTIRANSMFRDLSRKSPGPSNYRPSPSRISHSFSIGTKFDTHADKWVKSVPGPGNYQHLQLINQNYKIPLSNFESCPNTKFGRFKRLQNSEKQKAPGVGSYNVEKQILAKQKLYFKGRTTFGKSERKELANKKILTPGPGAYNKFSQFLH